MLYEKHDHDDRSDIGQRMRYPTAPRIICFFKDQTKKYRINKYTSKIQDHNNRIVIGKMSHRKNKRSDKDRRNKTDPLGRLLLVKCPKRDLFTQRHKQKLYKYRYDL